jgi:hypothetical protein
MAKILPTINTKAPEYGSWVEMRMRCDPKRCRPQDRPFYANKGIKVYPRWEKSFLAFLSYIGPKPGRGYSVDRIDPNKGYEPGNVRWATQGEQVRNRKSTRWITMDGRTQCLKDWCDELGIVNRQLASQRIVRQGWDPIRAITTPPRRGNAGKPSRS